MAPDDTSEPRSPDPDLPAITALESAAGVLDEIVERARRHLAGRDIDDCQTVAYDLAHVAATARIARLLVDDARHHHDDASPDADGRRHLATAFCADAVADTVARLAGRHRDWGVTPEVTEPAHEVLEAGRRPDLVAALHDRAPGPDLDDDLELVADTFRRFAEERIRPVAGDVHRHDRDVPDDIVTGLAELGAFGLSVPTEHGGCAPGGGRDQLAMVVATEELSRGSLGIGGSLMTRPEILTRALLAGGTPDQKATWLPRIASGDALVAVAVTEPDRGSDVADLRFAARPAPDGGWLLDGTKTWCTFAGRAEVLMLLARTGPDPGHRGLSLFVVPKPRDDGHAFDHVQDAGGGAPGGGRLQGRAIATIGYRGMHSYEVAFHDWWVPSDALIGGDAGRGRGFYLTMEGFENGRLQTAARALGVMRAAHEAATAYAAERIVFGRPVSDHELTRVKLGRMAMLIAAGRAFTHHTARLMGRGAGALEASMVKAHVCRAAEWVTREAMQIHGAMGYAEEYEVSRLFVDARVLPIFEGTDETLCLKVISRRLLREG